MVLLGYFVFGFVLGLVLSFAIGRGRRRQRILAIAGPASLGALVLIALARGCPANAHECSPGLTLFYGALLGGCITIGWLAGIGVSALVRRVRQSRTGSSASQGVR
jgi:hypothetical protein